MSLQKKPITGVMLGAGGRGFDAYGAYALAYPDRINFIAVAEPIEEKRKRFQKLHNIPDKMAFNSWEDVILPDIGKIADVAFICMQDNMHYEPAIKALKLDYDLLLEKPIAPKLEECKEILELNRKKQRIIQVGHVLRYTGFWKKIKEIIDSGKIGKILHIDHSENVAYYHFGHSFVRGNWKSKEESSPLILAKTCHDLDLLTWMTGEKAESVQSTGDLTFYRPENAPKDAPERCTDGCPHAETCPWYAPRLYLNAEPLIRMGLTAPNKRIRNLTRLLLNHHKFVSGISKFIPPLRRLVDWKDWPINIISTDLSYEGKMKALREGPYGICIYKTGNDVVDHQISTLQFPSGCTGTLTVHGMSDIEGREIRIFGSQGSIRGIFRGVDETITVTNLITTKPKIVFKSGLSAVGHGGGDFGLMDAFTSVLLGEQTAQEAGVTGIEDSMESHFYAFAAEDARITHNTVELQGYRKS